MASYSDFFVEPTDRPVKVRSCDCAGCAQPGDYRAPKSRDSLNDYYWFCIDHVREYNQHWNYFAGLSTQQMEDHMRRAMVWDRPTWPLGQWQERERKLREQVMNDFLGETAGAAAEPSPSLPKAERDALAVLELKPPVHFADVKAQYRLMVKRHHPDLHGGSAEAEEKFKSINLAFTLLRQMYGEVA